MRGWKRSRRSSARCMKNAMGEDVMSEREIDGESTKEENLGTGLGGKQYYFCDWCRRVGGLKEVFAVDGTSIKWRSRKGVCSLADYTGCRRGNRFPGR